MSTYRNTYVEINISNIKNNVKKIINTYNNYDYYFGVVKADSYGHDGYKVVKAILDGGCNYLAVATLDEALEIRKFNKDVPILCLGIIPKEFILIASKNNITITIGSLEYLKDIINLPYDKLKVHIKVNTGMNRLGISNNGEILDVYNLIKSSPHLILEGIFTHIYDANNSIVYNNQIDNFLSLTTSIDLATIPIVHIAASDALTNYPKPSFVNGTRLGIIMYGFNNSLKLNSTFKLVSTVSQINTLNPGDTVGYNGIYKATKKEKIAVVSIGYADGIIRKNTGRYVFINNKQYPIVGNICMDMLFVKIDDSVKVNDSVEILKDIDHICYTAKYLDTIPYEILCSIGKRVPRIYI